MGIHPEVLSESVEREQRYVFPDCVEALMEAARKDGDDEVVEMTLAFAKQHGLEFRPRRRAA